LSDSQRPPRNRANQPPSINALLQARESLCQTAARSTPLLEPVEPTSRRAKESENAVVAREEPHIMVDKGVSFAQDLSETRTFETMVRLTHLAYSFCSHLTQVRTLDRSDF